MVRASSLERPSMVDGLEPTLVSDASPPRRARLRPGTRVGRYEIAMRVGAGAMGEVYAADDPHLGRRVALKLLHGPRTKGGDDLHARLLREGQALARLSDPHVVPVYDMGTRGDRVFVAMELVDGVTLRRWAQARRRPWQELVRVMIGAGRGLAAAHRAGLVHRDFKPDNVLVDHDDRARVMDFGLARGLADDQRGAANDLAISLTRSGAVMGTPSYMSPEQHAGHRVDARSDQFSFCVALFELLYGVRPYLGPSVVALARQKHHRQVRDPRRGPLATQGRDVPRWLHRAIVRGLHPEPERRWPSMDALLEELARCDQAPRRWHWLAIAGVSLVIGGLSGGMVGDLLQGSRAPDCSWFEQGIVSAAAADRLTSTSACSGDPGHRRPTVTRAEAHQAGGDALDSLKSRD